MNAFHLRHVIREVLTTSSLADPRALSEEVFRRIPPKHYGAALRECLPDVVREENRRPRVAPAAEYAGSSQRSDPGPSSGRSAPAAEAAEPLAEQHGTVPARPRAARPVGRSKAAAMRAWWRRELDKRVHVGPASEDWKVFGDCLFEDLMFMAQERRDLAARNSAKAEEYAQLADVLKAHDVKQVRDLPEEVLRTWAGGEEA